MLNERLTEVFRFWRYGLTALLVVVLPFAFLGYGLQLGLGAPLDLQEDTLFINWPTLALLALLYPLASGTLIAQMGALNKGQAASFTQCLSLSLAHAFPLLLCYALLIGASYLGFLVLILPGVWLYARLSQGPIIVLLEKQNAVEGLRQSFMRTEKHQWQIFLGILVMASLILVATLVSASISQALLGESPLGDVLHLLLTAPVGVLLDILIFRFYCLETPSTKPPLAP